MSRAAAPRRPIPPLRSATRGLPEAQGPTSLPGSGLLRPLQTLGSPRLHQLSKTTLHAETGAVVCFLPPACAPHPHPALR